MCGALAIRPPSASKTAQEKSSRSLMLTECAVDCSRTPICSATDMNRLLKISSMTGSASVLTSARPGRGVTRDMSRSARPVTTARQPGSTTVVASSSVMMAGPSTACPGRSPARGNRSTSAQARPVNMRTRAGLSGRSVVFRIRTGRVVTVLVFLLRPSDLDRNSFHDDGLVAHEEGEAAGVFGLEGGGHVRQRADSDDDPGVGALVAQVRPARGGDPAVVPALGFHLRPGVVFQRSGDLRQPGQEIAGERRLDGLLAHGDDVGQPDPVRGQHAGQRVDEHPGHAQRVGDRAGVLPARAAEHVEHVLGHVVAALHRDLLDRVGHVGHGDLDEAGRDLLGAAGIAGGLGDPIAEFRKFRFRNIRV